MTDIQIETKYSTGASRRAIEHEEDLRGQHGPAGLAASAG